MRSRTVAGLLVVSGACVASACTQVLGQFDFKGGSTGSGGATGHGGEASSSTTGSTGGGASGSSSGSGTTSTGTASSSSSSSASSSSGSAGSSSSSASSSSSSGTTAPPGSEVWGKGFSGDPSLYTVTVDKQGNSYVTGQFNGTLAFGTQSFTAPSGVNDYFLASFDPTGEFRWGAAYDAIDIGSQYFATVATDTSGNVYFVASFNSQTVSVGSSTYTNPSGDGADAVLIVSYTSTGTVRWVSLYGGTEAYPGAIGVDSTSALVVTGAFQGNLTFGSTTLQRAGTTTDVFLAKIAGATGMPVWASQYTDVSGQTANYKFPTGLAIDSANDIVVTGQFSVSIQLGGNALLTGGNWDIFLAKFPSTGGSATWGARYGSPQADDAGMVAVDPGNDIIMIGGLGGTGSVGGTTTLGAGCFVSKYNTMGTFTWAQGYPTGCGLDQVATDANSNVILAGATAGSINFGGGPLTAAGTKDNVYLAKLGPTGSYDWAKMFGDTQGQYSPAVATDPSNNDIVLAFANDGTVNLGSNTIVSTPSTPTMVLATFNP